MIRVQLPASRLDELVSRFARRRIAVVGDFFLDKYLDVDPRLAELSIETGKTAHQVAGVRCSPGAAGTVVCNLAALSAGVIHAVGFIGDDGEGYDLRQQLNHLDCRTAHLHTAPDRRTPTYLKPRDIDSATLDAEHSRYDTKNRHPTPPEIQEKIIQSIDGLIPEVDAIVVQDQVEEVNCGVVTGTVRDWLARRAAQTPKVIFWADSRRRIRQFRNLIVKPNQFEAVGNENPQPEDEVPLEALIDAARRMRYENDAPVVITRGSRGMLASDPQWTLVPGVKIEGPVDPTGAGDSATAGAVLALCAGAELPQAALVGTLVASLTIQQIGTTGTASPEQLRERLAMWREQQDATD